MTTNTTELPEPIRAYDALVCAGQTITRMMQAEKNPRTVSALATAHRAVVEARQAMLPLIAEAHRANT